MVLGDSAEGWYSYFLENQIFPKTTKVICLTAPIAPVSLNGGYEMTSWYDIIHKDVKSPKKGYSYDDFIKNGKIITEQLDIAIKEHDNDSSKVFLGGFS